MTNFLCALRGFKPAEHLIVKAIGIEIKLTASARPGSSGDRRQLSSHTPRASILKKRLHVFLLAKTDINWYGAFAQAHNSWPLSFVPDFIRIGFNVSTIYAKGFWQVRLSRYLLQIHIIIENRPDNQGRSIMKANKWLLIPIIIMIYIFPLSAVAEEITTDVLIVIKPDKILAFSAQNKNWVPHTLKLKEKVQSKKAHGNVAVVITNERLYGFSAISGQWDLVELWIDEKIKDFQAEGNVATVTTDQRIFGFNAHTGLWSEYK